MIVISINIDVVQVQYVWPGVSLLVSLDTHSREISLVAALSAPFRGRLSCQGK